MNFKAYSPTRIIGALRRRGLAYVRKLHYQPGKLPIQKGVVLFDSFNGKVIGDNPLDIFLELQKVRPDLKFYWTVGAHTKAPAGATGVRFESKQWLDLLASAEYIVANTSLPWYFRKAAGQTYVQTWHGTPLKRLVHDIPPGSLTKSYLDTMDREAAAWDYLISPSPFCSEVLPRAFGYMGEVLETGYPRNDRLTTHTSADRQKIRESLGVTDSKTVLILYAPTWRDYKRTATGNWDLVSYLDPGIELPEGFQIMFRGHTNTHNVNSAKAAGNALDVTKYPDVTELYIAADVLITDYSSVMFDFTVTGKPVIFLAPDLERYESERGFYFDFEGTAPGPILKSEQEVLEILSKLPETAKSFQNAYKDWQQTFNSLEDGKAAKRVIGAVWPLRQ
jgi:CDP-glycerol glycerophosphotransferase